MVSGATLPDGDPYLQRQNEPSGAVSTRNPLHLLAGANDYRTVDIPGLPNDNEESKGDAWLGVFKSFDGGQTWRSTLLPGYPQDTTAVGKASPLYGYAAGADATMRAGTNGLFYYSGLAFNRGANGLGVLFVSRFIDNNNAPGGDPIPYLGTAILDKGTAGQFVDKPTMAVDIPRAGAGTCTVQSPGVPQPQVVPAGNVYVAYVTFMGGGPGGAKAKTPNNPVSRLLLTRSTNCGVTWSSPIKVSEGVHVNQGATLAIDPVSGAVYLAWREFIDATQPAAIHIVKSTDAGKTFSKPTLITKFRQFDQGGTKSSFRTNSYPSMSVDGTGRVYVAWAERWAAAPGGDARIVMTSSLNLVTWTERQPVETLRVPPSTGAIDPATKLPVSPAPVGPVRGHQVMPVVSTTGGKITVIYYDFGDDVSTIRNQWLSDGGATTATKRHTADVRVVQAAPADVPVFGPSVRVSQYLMGSRKAKGGATPQIEQLQFNVPNLPLYSQGEMAFLGDYIDVSGVAFVQDATGKWVFNTSSTGPSAMFAFWTDNRDVRPPRDGNWKNYTRPGLPVGLPGEIGVCIPGQTGMRNANIYSARITEGLLVGSPTNTKRLGQIGTRSFVVFAQNATQQTRRFRFTILNQPAGGMASFRQPFASLPGSLIVLPAVDVTLAPRSSGSRTVYVTSSDPKATVKVDVTEVELPTPAPPPAPGSPKPPPPPIKTNGLQSTIILNPDVTNPDVENPDVENPDVMNEVFNPDVENPDVTNPDVENPDVTNPDVENPDVENVQIANPDVTNPDVENPDVENPDVENPDVENPDVTNPDVKNGSITDVSWTIKNSGNTTGSFAVKPFLTKNAPAGFKKQLILHKIYTTPITKFDECEIKTQTQNVLISNVINPDVENPDVENPDVENPDVENPDVENPDVTNATLSLEPGESARITLRVVSPDFGPDDIPYAMVERDVTRSDGTTYTAFVPEAFDPSEAVAPIVFTQAVGTEDAAAGVTQTPVVLPLVISTLALPSASATLPYFSQLTSVGGDGPRTWSIVDQVEVEGEPVQVLPRGLQISLSTGVIYGSPIAPGFYPFTVQVTDSAIPPHVNTQALSIVVDLAPAPVVVREDTPTPAPTTATVNNAVVDSALGFAIALAPTSGQLGSLGGLPPGGVSAVYAPVADFNGSDAFTYNATLMTAAGPLTALGTVLLTVEPVNDVPSFTKGPDQTVLEDAGAQTVAAWATAISKGPANEVGQTLNFVVSNDNAALFAGPPAIAPDGTLSYTPAANANGSATVTVRIHDDGGVSNGGIDTSAAQTFVINVTPVNDVPSFTKGADRTVLEDSGDQTAAGWATAIGVGPADEVAQTPNFIVSSSNTGLFSPQPAVAADGTLTFTPAPNANGTATVTVQVHDDGGVLNGGVDTSGTQTFTITVTAANDPPVGINDPLSSVAEDSGVRTISFASLLGNDSTGPNEAEQGLTITAVGGAVGGSVSISGTDVLFTPAVNFNGPASFDYTLEDNGTTAGAADFKTATATVSFAVTPVNDVPTAASQAISTDEDTDLAVTLAGVDLETAPANLSVAITTPPLHGTLSGTAPNLTYTPTGNYNGSDSFAFAVTDGGDPDNCGTASVACAAALTSAPATVGITVVAVNDVPSFASGADQTVPEDSGAQSVSGWATAISAGPPDESTQALNFIVSNNNAALFAVAPAIAANGTLTFTPAPNANGPASVTVQVRDSGGTADGGVDTSTTQTFTITVSPVNDVPTATPQAVSTNEDVPLAVSLTGTDIETSLASLSFAITTPPLHGTLSGTAPNLTYTPTGNYNGPDSFAFTVTDRGDPDTCGAAGPACAAALTSASSTVTITVVPVNDAPTATAQAVSTNEDAATAVTLAGVDQETTAANLVYTITTPPSHGSLGAVAGQGVTYTPTGNYNGPDSFAFTVTDRGDPDTCGAAGPACAAALTSAPATVSVTVTEVNDPPVGVNDPLSSVAEDSGARTISFASLLGNDSTGPNEGEQRLTITVVGGAVGGSVSISGTDVLFTPAVNFNGPASFDYTLQDDGTTAGAADFKTAAATVSFAVTPVNDVPTAASQAISTDEDTDLAVTLAGADLETAPTNLSVAITTPPLHGTLSGTAPNLTYTPTGNYNGPDSFAFAVTDRGDPDNCGTASVACAAALTSAPATVTITVVPANDAPTATVQAVSTNEDSALPVTLTGVDQETAAAANLVYTITTPPSHGSLGAVVGQGVTYTPTGNYNGPDGFAFTVTDRGDPDTCGAPGAACAAALTSAPATVTITVVPVNDAPTATVQAVSTNEEAAVAVTLTGADQETATANLIYTITTAPTHGTLSAVVGQGVTYTPTANYNGADSLAFTVTDRGDPENCGAPGAACAATLTSAPATVGITVAAVNDAPSFTRGADPTVFDNAGAQTITNWATNISAGPPDEGSQLVTFTAVAVDPLLFAVQPAISPGGTLTFTPAYPAGGSTGVSVTLADGGGILNGGVGTSATQSVTITIQRSNVAPVASNDAYATNEDTPLVVSALPSNLVSWWRAEGNALDSEGTNHGTLLNATFGAGQVGQAFQTNATDYVSVPDAPSLNRPGSFAVAAWVNLTANGTANHVVSKDLAGTAFANYNLQIYSNHVALSLAFDQPWNGLAPQIGTGACDPGGCYVAGASFFGDAAHPNGTWRHIVGVYDNATKTITVYLDGVEDGRGVVDTSGSPYQTIGESLLIGRRKYPPQGTVNGRIDEVQLFDHALTAAQVQAVYQATTTAGVLANDTDANADLLTAVLVGAPAHGDVTLNADGAFSYTPAADYNGSDSFTYKANDGQLDSSIVTVSLTVTSVNDAPSFAKGNNLIVNEDALLTSVTGWATLISAGAADESVQAVNFLVSNTNNGLFSVQPAISPAGLLTFAPTPNANGAATMTVQLHDNGGTANVGADTSAAQTFTITVTAVDDAPVAVNDSYTTPEDTVLTVDAVSEFNGLHGLLFNDSDVDSGTLTASYLTNPTHGTLLPHANGSFSYTPAADYHGPDSFTYRASDGNLTSNIVTVNLTVTAVNDAPVAVDDSAATTTNVPVTIAVLANDSDIDNDSLTITVVGDATSGAAVLNGDGTITYSPALGFVGFDSFTYQIDDNHNRQAVATVTVAVGAVVCSAEPAGLVNWWSGNGNLTDSTGGLTLAPSGIVAYAPGKVGQALSFDGSSYASTPYAYAGPFTVDLWAKANAPGQPTFTSLLSTGNFGGSTPFFQIELDGSGNYRLDAGNLDLTLPIGPAGSPAFQHIAITYDGTDVRTYLNGQLVASGPWVGTPLGFEVFKLGVNRNGNLGFNGLVDEAHLFHRALTLAEVQSIYLAGSLGVCPNLPPVTTADESTTVTGTPLTLYPASNDTDPETQMPGLVQTLRAHPQNVPNLVAPGEVAVVNSTGLGYFSAFNFIGILDTTTNAIAGSIPLSASFNTTGARVNQSTGIVYFRIGNMLVAVDGRPASPTFNQVILSLTLGSIQSMALDQANGRLYVTNTTSGTGTITQSRVSVIDIRPEISSVANPNFHEVVQHVLVTAPDVAAGIDVNPVTNKVYVGAGTHLYQLDGSTLGLLQLPLGGTSVVVNDAVNLVYTVSGSTLRVFDGTIANINNAVIATVTLPAPATTGAVESRLAVHKASGRVYVRLSEFPSTGRLIVIDGNRGPGIGATLSQISIGRESGTTAMAIDQAGGKLITTSPVDHKSTVIDAGTSAVLGTIPAPQGTTAVGLNTVAGRAYVTGGTGALQVVNLATATLFTQVQTGVEVDYLVTDLAQHVAYVPQTGLTTAVQAVDANGVAQLIDPNSEGVYFGRAVNSVTGRIYVANNGATVAGGSDALPGYVAVIDGQTRAVIAKVPAGNRPASLAVDEALNKIYVANAPLTSAFPGGISVIDAANNNAVTSADLSLLPLTSPTTLINPSRLTINPATGKVYFLPGGSTASLAVLNGATNVASALPSVTGTVILIRANPVLNRIYVVAQVTGQPAQLYVFNGATDQVVMTLAVGGRSSMVGSGQSYLAVNRTTGQVFVADFDLNTLTVIDGATNTVLKTLPVGRGPTSVAVDETTNRIYVSNSLDRTVMFINGGTLRVESTLAVPLMPTWIEVDPAVKRLFVNGGCISGSSRCPWFDTGVMVIADPGSPNGVLSTTGVTQGANGTVALNADGSVTYTANTGFSGTDSYTYTVSDGHGGSTTATVNVTVVPALAITTASLPVTTVGSNYLQTIVATGGTGARSWNVSSGLLPGGLVLNSSGVLTGTARQAGTFAFSVTVRDSATPAQTATAAYSVTVGPPVITTTSLPNPFVGTPYSQQLSAGGVTGTAIWTLNTFNNPLLSWLSMSTGGVLSGQTAVAGALPSFTVTVSDSNQPAQLASRSFSLNVGGPLDLAPLREGIVLETQPLTLVGGNGTRTVTLSPGSDPLPPGLQLVSSGSFTGAPTRHGTYNFSVDVRDCDPSTTCTAGTVQQVVTKNLTLRVSAKDQQGNSGSSGSIGVGGAAGPTYRRLAQVVTVGAQGTLTAIGLQSFSCPSNPPVTIEIQRLTLAGLPDGTTIATGTATANYNAIAMTPAPGESLDMPIDSRFAFIVSSPVACTFTSTSTADNYNAGDAYVDAGGGWVSLLSTDGRYDLPSFRTLIQPAMDVAYLNTGRGGLTGTLLNNGKVLLAGHSNSVVAELYDPATHASTVTGNMTVSRQNASATLLVDGKVLVVGGRDSSGNRFQTAEIYDPATGLFTATAGSMGLARELHRAIRLNDGRVLITGGQIGFQTRTASAEIYDPASKTFSALPNMTMSREQHTATLLTSGKVLVAGGHTSGVGSSAELFDPATGQFTGTNGAMVVSSRGRASATLLSDGKVLIAGGQSGDVRNEAELYDPDTDGFSATGPLASKRNVHTATLLDDGSVLIAGGFDQTSVSNYIPALASMERWVPATGTFVPAGGMEARRQDHVAVRLPGDKVLLAGGFGQSWMTGNTAELYDPASVPAFSPVTLSDGQPGTPYAGVIFTPTGGAGPPYAITHVSGVLPQGVTYDAPTKTLSGTPGAAATGLYTFALQVTDAAGRGNVQSLTLRVGALNTITSPYRLVDGAVNQPYAVQLAATGVQPIVWSLLPGTGGNPLPLGLFLSSSGAITGTPTSSSYYNFAVRAIDAQGVAAIKTLSINVVSPMTITTTTLGDGVFGSGYGGCLGANNGIGNRTWSLNTGSLPTGVTLQTDGCFSGTVGDFGTFNFTARVTDESSPPQQPVSQPLSITVVLLADQNAGWDGGQPQLPFSGPTKIAERVVAGVSGMLSAVRISGNAICTAGTTITAAVQGVAPNGGPDGNTVSTGIAVYPSDYFALAPPVFFAADQQFTLVFSADAACALRPLSYDSSPGEGYVYNGGWQRLRDTADARYDIPFQTLVLPPPGLSTLRTSRAAHTATVLDDGNLTTIDKVLMISDQTAELYDPNDGTFTSTGALNLRRQRHTATLLDTGEVLVTGGSNFSCVGQNCTTTYLSSAEIYHPTTGTFELLAGPGNTLTTGRAGHTATKLGNGTVLITGGYTSTSTLRTAEIYTPGSGFAATGTMSGYRYSHAATLLPGDRVLITAGYGSYNPAQSAEIYDSTSGLFAATAGPMQVMYRARHTATLIPASGKVLIAGGSGSSSGPTAELFDPAAGGTFASLGNMTTPRVDHTATLLGDGSVLLAGGVDDTGPCCPPRAPQASVERYVSGAGFSNMGSMLVSRYTHTATFLPATDKVLLAGTSGWSSAAGRLAELFDPAAPLLASVAAPAGSNGTPYAGFMLNGQGGAGPLTISLTSGTLPPGLIYNPATGTISGTPTQSGTFTVSFTVTDGIHSNTQSLTFRIDALTITTASLPTAYTGQYYAAALTATGFGAKTWSHTGSLPAGLFLNASGTITGTPTASCCSFSFTVRAEDAAGQIATRNLSIYLQSPTDQQLSTQTTPAVAIPSTRRVAQVFRSGTPYDLTGVQLYSISSCSANAQITARVWPVSGAPARPDESGGTPLGIASVTASSSGYFNGILNFSPPIPMPQHAQFAIVVEIGPSGASCQGMNWPVNEWYPVGQGWVSDNLGAWQSSTTAIGRADIPLTTLVVPDGGMKFLSSSRSGHASATLTDGRVLLIGSDATAEIYDPVTHTLTRTAGNMSTSRNGATATPLAGGKALIVGGSYWDYAAQKTVALATTEIFDPANGGTFSAGPIMPVTRYRHTATPLGDGRVLIAGGDTIDTNTGYSQSLQSALLFDDTVALLGPVNMTGARTLHSATLLPDGRVLIAGGYTGNPWPPTMAEIYDPSGGGLGAFSGVADAMAWRADHTATLLTCPVANAGCGWGGKVLIVGGNGSYPELATTSELFDPGPETFTPAPGLATRRSQHTATALPDGRIVIAGGGTSWQAWMPTSSVELYDPVANQFTTVSNLLVDRTDHTVDLISVGPQAGNLVVAGGGSWSWLSARTLEVYDPSSTDLVITTGSLPDGATGQAYPATVLTAAGGSGVGYAFAVGWGQLPDGLVLNPNGTISGTPVTGGPVSFTVQVTDSNSNVANRTFTITVNRLTITSTSPLPVGTAGGNYSHQLTATGVGAVTWAVEPGNTLPGSVTLNSSGLLSGPTPVVGGWYFNVRATDASGQGTVKGFSLQVVQPPMTVATAAMQTEREGHTATVLIDGRLLVAGGYANSGYLASAEVYDPTTDTWTPVGSMSETRGNHVAVRLEDGRVIVAGGNTNAGTGFTASAEIFDPATGLWAATPNTLSVSRARPAAVRLNDGRVLVAGGTDDFYYHSTADIFDPSSGTWSQAASMTYWRYAPSMTMLPTGHALIMGSSFGGGQQSSEEFDPATGTWGSLTAMNDGHAYFQAVTLADGRVLVAGGSNSNGANLTTEIYTSGSGWAPVAALNVARHSNPLVVLPDGRAAVVGGYVGPAILSSIETNDPASANPWSIAGALSAARYNHSANRLQTGQVLVTGGYGTGGVALTSTERFGDLSLPSVSATAGGNGGTPFRFECSPTAAATGLRGRAGDDIDRTELWCAKPAPSFGPAMFADGRGSLSGGSPYALDCPANMVMTGVHGEVGGVVDTLGIDCQNLNTLATDSSATVGIFGGGSPFALSCPAGQAVVGLYGRQGALMDQIGLLCKVPTP